MRGRVVKIGNSQGIRIPKPLLEQIGVVDDVELVVKNNQIIIRALSNPREGWESSFEKMSENKDDSLVMDSGNISHSWDEEEWKW